jgi:ABC-type branched-subunit amino acid transport system substrate-binding protein
MIGEHMKGMGINFVKQFVAAGLSRDTQLFAPGFSADEDVIKAVGAPMMGMFNSSHWAHDMENAENKRFVAEFEKEYKRLPTLYAAQGYDTALLIDAAVRAANGKIDDKEAMIKTLKTVKFNSVRGEFRFNTNQGAEPTVGDCTGHGIVVGKRIKPKLLTCAVNDPVVHSPRGCCHCDPLRLGVST